MDSFEIIITPDAEADLYEIRNYIAGSLRAPDVALNYIRELRNAIHKLSYMGASFAFVENEPWHSLGVRKIIAKNFYRKMTRNNTTAPRRTVTSAPGLFFGFCTGFLRGHFTERFTLKIDPGVSFKCKSSAKPGGLGALTSGRCCATSER